MGPICSNRTKFPFGGMLHIYCNQMLRVFFGWKLHSWYSIYSNSCKDCIRFIGNHSGRNPKRLNSDLFPEKRGPGFEFRWLGAPQWITDIDHPSWMTWIIDFAWIIKWVPLSMGKKQAEAANVWVILRDFPLSCPFCLGWSLIMTPVW